MTTRIINPVGGQGFDSWSLERDQRGHRSYKLRFLVGSNDPYDGPNRVLATPGFPLPGSFWVIGNDVDVYAWCRWNASVKKRAEDDVGGSFPLPDYSIIWECELTFSTAPDESWCRTVQAEDPILEPVKINGGTVKYQEEATFDLLGNQLVTSSFEQMRGPQVEFDKHRGTVHIEYNHPYPLNYNFFAGFVDNVNSSTLWGNPPRTVKLSKFDFDKKFWGPCTPYATLKFDFDVNTNVDPATGLILGHDRLALDEGTKVLNGHWDEVTGLWVLDNIDGLPPDPSNPDHFIRFQDRNGNNARVVLNGAGLPSDPTNGPPGFRLIQKYPGNDFLLLGVPATL